MNDELDYLARQYNYESKLRNNKENLIGKTDINNFLNMGYDKGTMITNTDYGEHNMEGIYNVQGDYTDLSKHSIKQNEQNISIDSISFSNAENNNETSINFDSNSNDKYNDNISLSVSSKSSSVNNVKDMNIRDIDMEIRNKSKFKSNKKSSRHKCIDFDLHSIESLDSLDSGESLLRHIRHCKTCKSKVVNLIKDKKKTKTNELHDIKNIIDDRINNKLISNTDNNSKKDEQIKNDNNTKETKYFNKIEMKEILIIILIGVLIIILLEYIFN
jgi:hypothetical protein